VTSYKFVQAVTRASSFNENTNSTIECFAKRRLKAGMDSRGWHGFAARGPVPWPSPLAATCEAINAGVTEHQSAAAPTRAIANGDADSPAIDGFFTRP